MSISIWTEKVMDMKFVFKYNRDKKLLEVYGPSSPEYAYEGDKVLHVIAPDSYSGRDQAVKFIEKKFSK